MSARACVPCPAHDEAGHWSDSVAFQHNDQAFVAGLAICRRQRRRRIATSGGRRLDILRRFLSFPSFRSLLLLPAGRVALWPQTLKIMLCFSSLLISSTCCRAPNAITVSARLGAFSEWHTNSGHSGGWQAAKVS